MTESQRTTSEHERSRSVETDPLLGRNNIPSSTTSSPVGVYDQNSTTTTSSTPTTGTSSSNMMWIILLIVLIIVAFFVLRQWM